MEQLVVGSPSEELGRFLTVAQAYRQETGKQAFMPACPVDTEWHRLLSRPEEYQAFCHRTVGHDIRHEPAKGEGEVEWKGTYERMFGPLPSVWFRDPQGVLDELRHREYVDRGVFRAAWDCTPY